MSKPTLPHPKEIVEEEIQAALDRLSDREMNLVGNFFVVYEVTQIAALVSRETANRFVNDWKESRHKVLDLPEERADRFADSVFTTSIQATAEMTVETELHEMLSSNRAAQA